MAYQNLYYVLYFIYLYELLGTGAAALFQQNSDRVLRAYAAAAPYPHSTSFAVDLFKTEKFPGGIFRSAHLLLFVLSLILCIYIADTDFRIFRDYSDNRIHGADFAYYRNGYISSLYIFVIILVARF